MIDAERIALDFLTVAKLSGVQLPDDAVEVQIMASPHIPPTRLPAGKMAVYVFTHGDETLKVGKVGAKSQARYTSQHYIPGSAKSTLAASILADHGRILLTEAEIAQVGSWIRANVDRVNFLIDERHGMRVLGLLEAFVQCCLKPRYEGFKSQLS